MAVLKSLSEFEGSIGNIVAYKRCDSDKTFLRTNGGVSKKEFRTTKTLCLQEKRTQNGGEGDVRGWCWGLWKERRS